MKTNPFQDLSISFGKHFHRNWLALKPQFLCRGSYQSIWLGFPHYLFLPLISTSFFSLLKLVSSLLMAITIPTTSGSFLRNSGTCARKEASTPVEDPLNLCLSKRFPLLLVADVKLFPPPKLLLVAIARAVGLALPC